MPESMDAGNSIAEVDGRVFEKNKKPTVIDIARIAGVSRTQVSDVLNNKREKHVSPEKRARILKVVAELGYSPHSSAQALRKGYANEFALFFPAPYTNRINALLGTIHESGLAEGCVPVQYSFNVLHPLERRQEVFRALIARKPRGLFLSLFDVSMDDVRFAQDHGVEHILLYDVEPHADFPTLVLPISAIGCLAARHLLERGHRRLGIIRPAAPAPSRVFQLRIEGMRRAMADYPDATLREFSWPKDDPRPTMEWAGKFLDSSGVLDGSISGLYAYSDEYAIPLVSQFLDRGIKIPQDIAIIGTDDVPFSSLIRPSLTSIQFDNVSLGKRAVSMINAMIADQPCEAMYSSPLVPVLVQRQTT